MNNWRKLNVESDFRLMRYDARWPQEFEQAKSLILWATEGWVSDVQHVGGTSFPGGVSRPIIDMLAGLRDLSGLNEAARYIEGLNYVRIPSPEWCVHEHVAMLCKPRVGMATHTVLLMRHGGALWNRTLAMCAEIARDVKQIAALNAIKTQNYLDSECGFAQYEAAKNAFYGAYRSSV